MDFSFMTIAFNVKKMCTEVTGRGIKRALVQFYAIAIVHSDSFRQKNRIFLQNIVA